METDTLSAFARARVPVGRFAFRALMASGALKKRLAARRPELDPDIAATLALDDLSRASRLEGYSATRARLRVQEQLEMIELPPPAGIDVRDLSFDGPGGKLAARLYTPSDAASASHALIYIHGGGFVTCSIASHDGLCRRLAFEAKMRVVSLDYRRAPEHPFPAAVEDVLAGTRFVLAHAEELGIDPKRVGVAGDSAGGNLSAVVSRRTKADARRPALAVLLYPATDTTCSLPSHRRLGERYYLTSDSIAWYYDHYLPNRADRSHPDASPLLSDDLAGLPKTIVVTAAFDPLVDEGRAYADKLRGAGVEVDYIELPAMIHGLYMLAGASAAARAEVERIAKRIARELGA